MKTPSNTDILIVVTVFAALYSMFAGAEFAKDKPVSGVIYSLVSIFYLGWLFFETRATWHLPKGGLLIELRWGRYTKHDMGVYTFGPFTLFL